MLLIGEEINEIENNLDLRNNNVISNAPHTINELISDNWNYPYSKEKASFPSVNKSSIKFWSSVSRINNAYGDRNLICSCNVNDDDAMEDDFTERVGTDDQWMYKTTGQAMERP